MQPVIFAIFIGLLAAIPTTVLSSVCGQDLNGDGFVDATNETATCTTTPQGDYCSVGSAACTSRSTCPLGNYACTAGSCQRPASCAGTPATVTGATGGTPSGYLKLISGSGNTLTFTYEDPVTKNLSFYTLTSSVGTFGGTVTWTATGLPISFRGGVNGLDVVSGGNLVGTISLSGLSVKVTGSVDYAFYKLSANGDSLYGYIPSTCDLAVPSTCTLAFSMQFTGEYVCSITGTPYADAASCQAACNETASCTTSNTCPLDPNLACMEATPGNYRCSPNSCVDLTSNPPLVTQDTTGPLPDNSGPRGADGTCNGNVSFFAGRSMRCGKSGVDTGFTDCCNQGNGDFYADSMGDAVQASLLRTGLQATAEFASLAAANFAYNLAGGYTASQAASGAASYALNNSAFLQLNPATIYITAAVFVVNYLMTPKCDQQDFETSALKASNMCHYIGDYCAKKWSGVGCVQRRESYCCFNSVLGRIVQEQGRPQLPTFNGWGTVKAPDCRGFTPEEFQSLDFGTMDLSEYFQYVEHNANQVIGSGTPAGTMSNEVQNFYNNIR